MHGARSGDRAPTEGLSQIEPNMPLKHGAASEPLHG